MRPQVSIVVLSVLIGACADPGVTDGPVTALVVRGAVVDAAGDPVPGAVVVVGWGPAECDQILDFPPDTTMSDGGFEVQAWEWGTFDEVGCVRIAAEPPAGRDLQASTLWVQHVPVTAHGLDTLTVQFALPVQ